MRGLLALILAMAAPSHAPAPPAADAPLPREPAKLAEAFTASTRQLRATPWDGTGETVPADVTLYALHHQRILRLMAERRPLGDATLAALPSDVRGEARDTVQARRLLDSIPRGKPPKVRVASAAPAATLRQHYAEAERRFGIHWTVLASINFVESAFGRVRSASESGARGPMQFMPATWDAYGAGGDIEDPHDAILAAARYLQAAGAPKDLDRALYAYNHSTAYVRAVRRYAARMRADERVFRTYYAWQVFVRTPQGARRITGPGV
ncbi:lytic transglycosylase domain-containing protein [Solirubrobacter phytolaccae]|uniref:Lytic transglycosylase domain-containing protein n=1 Tax=Solirubrobacter phytolaccae TaxID=1404360 RepID=A0A9X3SG48_9ACTN|nr:lytic transglycosylase domain-containing protein [Solirubrobacter phytolaccae]MDA0182057.1 lytic transglycosylase domain-containing protein [Solirubrobacter phytolaccae]